MDYGWVGHDSTDDAYGQWMKEHAAMSNRIATELLYSVQGEIPERVLRLVFLRRSVEYGGHLRRDRRTAGEHAGYPGLRLQRRAGSLHRTGPVHAPSCSARSATAPTARRRNTSRCGLISSPESASGKGISSARRIRSGGHPWTRSMCWLVGKGLPGRRRIPSPGCVSG